MRWEYASPAGKVFISDGKDVILYTPERPQRAEEQTERIGRYARAAGISAGKARFHERVQIFQTRAGRRQSWIVAEPKSENLAYTKVEFLALPDGEIRRVRVTGQDQSTLDFTFTNEQLNAPVSPSLFEFHPPPGVPVVEGAQ